MNQNPFVQTIFMFIGVICLAKLLAIFPLLLIVAIIFSGAFVTTIWIISQDIKKTKEICKYPIGERWIDFVQNISKVKPSNTDPDIYEALDQETSSRSIKIEMLEPEHFQEGKKWIKSLLKGHDTEINKLFNNLQTSVELYQHSVEKGHIIKKPVGSYLILGPSGIGKTYCARLMSKLLYPEKGFLMIPMNELNKEHDVNILFGGNSGGHNMDTGGQLTRSILKNPYQLILLDKINKSHPSIHDALFQVLNTGKSTDRSSGLEVNFLNSIIFATATLSKTIQKQLDAIQKQNLSSEMWKKSVIEVITSEIGFDYTFLTRFDQILYFSELDDISVAEIALLELVKHYKENGLFLTYTEPEVLLKTIERIQPTRDFGIHDLKRAIYDMTKIPMLEAKRSDLEYVQLGINDLGEVSLFEQGTNREIKPQNQMSISEIAILEIVQQYKKFGLTLIYIEPEIIMEAIERIQPVRNQNPSEISKIIFNMVKTNMIEATKSGMDKVKLSINSLGNICLVNPETEKEIVKSL
ncbi:protein disaggregation chaperone [Candidatus Magnetomorum sp. HK-1]|nr:protein disaggregation chaperone [Candidatus Magnetomorum sp. HK-1]